MSVSSNDSSPFNKHPQLVDLADKYELVNDIWGGTSNMREQGTEYLPREPGEESQNYTRRLDRTVLFPGYKNAIKANTGKIFAGGIDVDNVSPALSDLLFQIDDNNDNIEIFGQRATESGMHFGCSYILVDYPIINENATLEDERAAGAQPYWVLIEAPQVVEASPIYVGGRKRLGVFRYTERVAFRASEFDVGFVDQVKEFRIDEETGVVHYRVWRKVDNKDVLVDAGELLGMTEIPVAPLYINKVGFYLGSPAFMDLAYENVLHWQINSDYQNIVHHSQVPMLALVGMTSAFDDNGVKQEIVISPNTVIDFDNPNGSAEWIEVSGSASGVGRQAILDSYDRMSTLSLEALQSDTSTTATEARLDAAESIATIKLVTQNIELALEQAIGFTYDYLQIENPGTSVHFTIADSEELMEEEDETNSPAGTTSQSSGDDE